MDNDKDLYALAEVVGVVNYEPKFPTAVVVIVMAAAFILGMVLHAEWWL